MLLVPRPLAFEEGNVALVREREADREVRVPRRKVEVGLVDRHHHDVASGVELREDLRTLGEYLEADAVVVRVADERDPLLGNVALVEEPQGLPQVELRHAAVFPHDHFGDADGILLHRPVDHFALHRRVRIGVVAPRRIAVGGALLGRLAVDEGSIHGIDRLRGVSDDAVLLEVAEDALASPADRGERSRRVRVGELRSCGRLLSGQHVLHVLADQDRGERLTVPGRVPEALEVRGDALRLVRSEHAGDELSRPALDPPEVAKRIPARPRPLRDDPLVVPRLEVFDHPAGGRPAPVGDGEDGVEVLVLHVHEHGVDVIRLHALIRLFADVVQGVELLVRRTLRDVETARICGHADEPARVDVPHGVLDSFARVLLPFHLAHDVGRQCVVSERLDRAPAEGVGPRLALQHPSVRKDPQGLLDVVRDAELLDDLGDLLGRDRTRLVADGEELLLPVPLVDVPELPEVVEDIGVPHPPTDVLLYAVDPRLDEQLAHFRPRQLGPVRAFGELQEPFHALPGRVVGIGEEALPHLKPLVLGDLHQPLGGFGIRAHPMHQVLRVAVVLVLIDVPAVEDGVDEAGVLRLMSHEVGPAAVVRDVEPVSLRGDAGSLADVQQGRLLEVSAGAVVEGGRIPPVLLALRRQDVGLRGRREVAEHVIGVRVGGVHVLEVRLQFPDDQILRPLHARLGVGLAVGLKRTLRLCRGEEVADHLRRFARLREEVPLEVLPGRTECRRFLQGSVGLLRPPVGLGLAGLAPRLLVVVAPLLVPQQRLDDVRPEVVVLLGRIVYERHEPRRHAHQCPLLVLHVERLLPGEHGLHGLGIRVAQHGGDDRGAEDFLPLLRDAVVLHDVLGVGLLHEDADRIGADVALHRLRVLVQNVARLGVDLEPRDEAMLHEHLGVLHRLGEARQLLLRGLVGVRGDFRNGRRRLSLLGFDGLDDADDDRGFCRVVADLQPALPRLGKAVLAELLGLLAAPPVALADPLRVVVAVEDIHVRGDEHRALAGELHHPPALRVVEVPGDLGDLLVVHFAALVRLIEVRVPARPHAVEDVDHLKAAVELVVLALDALHDVRPLVPCGTGHRVGRLRRLRRLRRLSGFGFLLFTFTFALHLRLRRCPFDRQLVLGRCRLLLLLRGDDDLVDAHFARSDTALHDRLVKRLKGVGGSLAEDAPEFRLALRGQRVQYAVRVHASEDLCSPCLERLEPAAHRVHHVVAARVLLHLMRHRLVEVGFPSLLLGVDGERVGELLQLLRLHELLGELPKRMEGLVPDGRLFRAHAVADVGEPSGRQVDDRVGPDRHLAPVLLPERDRARLVGPAVDEDQRLAATVGVGQLLPTEALPAVLLDALVVGRSEG